MATLNNSENKGNILLKNIIYKKVDKEISQFIARNCHYLHTQRDDEFVSYGAFVGGQALPIAWVSFSKQDREYKKQLLYYLGIQPQNTLEIPFKYQKYNGNLKIEENSYPLSNVLRPIDSDKTVAQMDKDENNQYYLNCSEKKIKEVFK